MGPIAVMLMIIIMVRLEKKVDDNEKLQTIICLEAQL